LREQAAVCQRIANGLSWNSPGHAQFTEMAENFEKRATELEFQFIASPQVSEARQQLEQSQGQQPDDKKPERER